MAQQVTSNAAGVGHGKSRCVNVCATSFIKANMTVVINSPPSYTPKGWIYCFMPYRAQADLEGIVGKYTWQAKFFSPVCLQRRPFPGATSSSARNPTVSLSHNLTIFLSFIDSGAVSAADKHTKQKTGPKYASPWDMLQFRAKSRPL